MATWENDGGDRGRETGSDERSHDLRQALAKRRGVFGFAGPAFYLLSAIDSASQDALQYS
jgi:hypothetical protein